MATSYDFGPFRLEPDERRLIRHGAAIAITPKAFDLLVILVANADRLLKKDELMERLWPGVFVEEVNLAQNISALRRALGVDSKQPGVPGCARPGNPRQLTARDDQPAFAAIPATIGRGS